MKPLNGGEHPVKKAPSNQTYLQGVTSIHLAVDDVKDLFLDAVAGRVALAPVVGGTAAILANEEVLWVVDVVVRATLYPLNYLDWEEVSDRRSPTGESIHTLGSRSTRTARGMYLVSSL